MLLDRLNRIGKRLADTNDFHFRATRRVERNGVGEDEFLEFAIHDSLASIAGHDTVANDSADGFGSTLFHDRGRLADSTGSISNIVDKDYVLAIDITQYTNLADLIEVGTVLVADDHRHFVVGHDM